MPTRKRSYKKSRKLKSRSMKRSKRIKKTSKRKSRTMSKLRLKKLLNSTPKSRKALRKRLRSLIKHSGDGRGSVVRGWSGEKPQRGTERHRMKKKCGSRCFLLPKSEKFPICPKSSCTPTCRGISGAKARSHQHKYTKLYSKIDRLQKKYC
jgi:hypothetical protein